MVARGAAAGSGATAASGEHDRATADTSRTPPATTPPATETSGMMSKPTLPGTGTSAADAGAMRPREEDAGTDDSRMEP